MQLKTRQPQEQEEAGRTLPWSPQRRVALRHPDSGHLASQPRENAFLLF